MAVYILDNSEELGEKAAELIAEKLNEAIERKGQARIILSTGASQFETLKYLVEKDIDWERVTMFHLDEYLELPETHKASFRRYLKERFTSKVPVKVHFVNTEGEVDENLKELTKEIRKDIIERDERDMNREVSPLRQADDAVLVDSSEMGIDDVVNAILDVYKEKVQK